MSFHPEIQRRPAVAGRFYPGKASSLDAEVTQYLKSPREPQPAIAMIGPHAGFVYSGSILGETYASTHVPERVVIMCPNHTGMGVRRSLWGGGAWQLPSGALSIDDSLAARLVTHCKLEPDVDAHLQEHAIEVHLPFLQRRQPKVRIAPVVLAGLSVEDCREVGQGMARAIRETKEQDGDEVLIVASTDMSHFLSAAESKHFDEMALERVLALDPVGLYETVRRHDISMCGFIPTTCALFAALDLGAKTAELIRYGHSGETSGDDSRVVGYAGLLVR
jgi:hypothetical protein